MRGFGVVVAGLAVVAAAGCSVAGSSTTPSSSATPTGIGSCPELYTEGKVITNAGFGEACVTDGGELITPLPVRVTCEDNRVLMWNDLAWGYRDEPMTLTPAEEPAKVPEDVLSDCLTNQDTGDES